MHRSSVRKIASTLAALALVAVATQSARAQAKGAASTFGAGYTDIGPVIGIGGINGAGASFGARMEHGFKALPDLANGVLGIEGSFDYYSFGGASAIPLGATLNYHVHLDDPKIDPFIGLGLGVALYNCSGSCGGSSTVYFIGRAGARYFFEPNLAAYGDFGSGQGALHLGLMFKFN